MQKSLKILVVVGADYDNEGMLSEVTSVAIPNGATVTLLGMRDRPPRDPDLAVALSHLDLWISSVQLDKLQESRTALEQAGINTTVQQAAYGKAHHEIIQLATAGNYDLIMKPAASDGGKLSSLFGNRDIQLFRLSEQPVWIFKPTPANKLARVMIAVDPAAYDEEKSALSAKVLRWGKNVADTVGAELHVAHTWDLDNELLLRGSGKVGIEFVEEVLAKLEIRHKKWLDDAIAESGLDTDKTIVHFQKGDAADLIPAMAREQEADLLVMGSVGRTGISGLFIGNTAESVLRNVNCSVLAIKPDWFQTPIK